MIANNKSNRYNFVHKYLSSKFVFFKYILKMFMYNIFFIYTSNIIFSNGNYFNKQKKIFYFREPNLNSYVRHEFLYNNLYGLKK